MKFVVNRQDIAQAAKAGAAIVKSGALMPLHEMAKLTAAPNQASIMTTDGVIFYDSSFGISKSLGAGTVCVNAKMLAESLASLSGDAVAVTITEKMLELSSGKSKISLAVVGADGFPEPKQVRAQAIDEVDAASLLTLFNSVSFSASKDQSRFHLAGVFLEAEKGSKLRAVATDGHRLTLADSAIGGFICASIVPDAGVKAIGRFLASSGCVSVAIDGAYIKVANESGSITVRLTEGNFPPYKQIVPGERGSTVRVSSEVLTGVLKRASLMIKNTVRPVKLVFSKDIGVVVSADSPEHGSVTEELDVACNFDLTLHVNPAYILDMLNALPGGDHVDLDVGGELDPILVRSLANPTHLGVIMPMRG